MLTVTYLAIIYNMIWITLNKQIDNIITYVNKINQQIHLCNFLALYLCKMSFHCIVAEIIDDESTYDKLLFLLLYYYLRISEVLTKNIFSKDFHQINLNDKVKQVNLIHKQISISWNSLVSDGWNINWRWLKYGTPEKKCQFGIDL